LKLPLQSHFIGEVAEKTDSKLRVFHHQNFNFRQPFSEMRAVGRMGMYP
jgi:hypothetical protein